jgi:putative membrane protein insertion efficiency factor
MRGTIRMIIRAYQATLSPVLVAFSGSACRFEPTCSEYFLQAVERHGPWRGSWLGVRRIGRCHPWGGAGADPVPGVTADRCA